MQQMMNVPNRTFRHLKVIYVRGKKPAAIPPMLMVAVLWMVVLLYASLGLRDTADLLHVLAAMSILLAFITVLSLFPLAIYWWFDREEEIQRRRQLADAELKYHHLDFLADEVRKFMEWIYMSQNYRLPVFLLTLSLLMGWVIFFFSNLDAVRSLWGEGNTIFNFLTKLGKGHPVGYGFLGAYFFSLQFFIRRYINGDLKPEAFIHISVRIWIVMILTLVLSHVWLASPTALLAVCFSAGLTPNLALDLIQRVPRSILGRVQFKFSPMTTYEHIPLDRIQGLNLWHQARLAEEGIDSVQNLALANMVHLLTNTRLGCGRLMDWIDQAILSAHVGDKFKKFHEAGIRTATALHVAYMCLPQSEHGAQEQATMQTTFSYVPPVPPSLLKSLEKADVSPEQLRNVVSSIQCHENFARLREWRLAQFKALASQTQPQDVLGQNS